MLARRCYLHHRPHLRVLLKYRSLSFSKTSGKANPPDHDRFRIDDPSWDIEPLRWYATKGWLPLLIGDKLRDGRYKVLHKLGHDFSSTFWIAHDQAEPTPESKIQTNATEQQQAKSPFSSKLVVLRVPDAFTSDLIPDYKHHAEASHSLQNALTNSDIGDMVHMALRRAILAHDWFNETSPNGKHACLIYELPGPSLTYLARYSPVKGPEGRLQTTFARKVIKDITLTVASIHAVDVVHGGQYNIFLPIQAYVVPQLISLSTAFRHSSGKPNTTRPFLYPDLV
jgi:serine/threonine-protein kinase SRPK3